MTRAEQASSSSEKVVITIHTILCKKEVKRKEGRGIHCRFILVYLFKPPPSFRSYSLSLMRHLLQ